MVKWALIVGAGPSLRWSDLRLLRGHVHTVAVNCAVFYAPWADVLFAGDGSWWKYYAPRIEWFKGARISCTARMSGVRNWRGKRWHRTGGNSGHMAIQYAVEQGFDHIALIGFDHQKTGNKAHAHPDHPLRPAIDIQMGNVDHIARWPGEMDKTAIELRARGVSVVNLTRTTAITCFPRMTVEDFKGDLCL